VSERNARHRTSLSHRPLLVIDGDSLGHRAYHAMPHVEGAGGRPVGLLVGFANFLLATWRSTQPRAVIVCLDTRVPSYRHELLPGYQGQRDPFADDLCEQLDRMPEMTEAFGFDRYVAYGSDWGSLVTAFLALDHPDKLAALLITTPGFMPAVEDSALSEEEAAWRRRAFQMMAPESAYQALQGTKPQSLAYGHSDSPIALACWVIEKFHGWTVPGSPGDPPFPMDELLANVMLYWLNGAVAPMWLYFFLNSAAQIPPGRRVSTPAGFLLAPNDLVPPAPRAWMERSFNVAHYRVAETGGHFPGLDNADLLIAELQAFCRRTVQRPA